MTFIQIYLVRLTSDIGGIILQNVLNYAALLASYMLGSQLARYWKMRSILLGGLLFTASYYLCILLLQEKTSAFLVPLGLLNGIGQGLYYFSFNLLVGAHVEENEQGRFFSWQQSFNYAAGVGLPVLSGLLISHFASLLGYVILFALSLALFALAALLSRYLRGMQILQKMHVIGVLTERGNRYWQTDAYYHFSNGMREAIFNQIFTLFAYTIVTSEKVIGQYQSLMAVVGIFSSTLIASRFHRHNQRSFHLLAAILYALIMFILGYFQTPWALRTTYLGLGLVYCWNQTIFQSMKYRLAELAAGRFQPSDYMIACELPLAFGRIAGLLLALGAVSCWPVEAAYPILMVTDGLFWLVDHFVIDKKIQWLTEKL